VITPRKVVIYYTREEKILAFKKIDTTVVYKQAHGRYTLRQFKLRPGTFI